MCVHLHVHDVFLHLYVHDECASCVHADFALSSAVGMAAVQRNTSYMYTCARTHTRTHTNIYMYTHTHTHTHKQVVGTEGTGEQWSTQTRFVFVHIKQGTFVLSFLLAP